MYRYRDCEFSQKQKQVSRVRGKRYKICFLLKFTIIITMTRWTVRGRVSTCYLSLITKYFFHHSRAFKLQV